MQQVVCKRSITVDTAGVGIWAAATTVVWAAATTAVWAAAQVIIIIIAVLEGTADLEGSDMAVSDMAALAGSGIADIAAMAGSAMAGSDIADMATPTV